MTTTSPGSAVRLAEIRDTPLSVDEVLAAVASDGVGGTAVFIGSVRDTDHGKPVAALAYSAHPLAASRMREIAAEVAGQEQVLAVAALHRVGELSIGDAAVIVGVGGAHRDEAFRAARLLIDRIKAEVPLWKHQRYADGTEEWVGACDTE